MSVVKADTHVECLQRVLVSRTFAQSHRLREFLQFVGEQVIAGHGDSVKEVTIGIKVFGRLPGYDPKLDNVVRASARRLRSKLEEYYETEGASDPLRIVLPKGSYIPSFETWSPLRDTHAETIPFFPPELTPGSKLAEQETRYPGKLKLSMAALLIAVLVLLIWWSRTQFSRQERADWHSVPFAYAPGYQLYPAFSPDGKSVAFTWTGVQEGVQQIYVQPTDNSSSAVRLTDGALRASRPVWSPDGKQIAYVQLGESGHGDVMLLNLADRTKKKLADLTLHNPWLCNEPRLSWSPSGKEILTVEGPDMQKGCGVILIDVPSAKRRVVTRPPLSALADVEPAFSPDGRSIAFLRQSSASIADIYIVPAHGGELQRLTFDDREIRSFAWNPDGQSLIIASRRQGNFINLWKFSTGQGWPTRLTEGPINLGFPSVNTSADSIAYTAYRDNTNIWRLHGNSLEPLITSRNTDWSPQYSPDGRRIAFVSDQAGNLDVWIADADGREQKRLTNFVSSPAGSVSWSPDSRRLAFDVRLGGRSSIYLATVDGQDRPVPLDSSDWHEALPSWSHDGQWIYFSSPKNGTWNVYRESIRGGKPVPVTTEGGFRALESQDGRSLYFTKYNRSGIWQIDLQHSGNEQLVVKDFPAASRSEWALGPAGLCYMAYESPSHPNTPATITCQDSHGQTRQLGRTQRPTHHGGFSVSPDGTTFLFSQLDASGSDILLLQH